MQTTFVKMIFSMNCTLKFYMHQCKEHILNLYRYFILFGNENNSIDEFFAIFNSICVLHILCQWVTYHLLVRFSVTK